MSSIRDPKIPIIVSAIVALVMVIDYYVPSGPLDPVKVTATNFRNFVSIVTAFALLAGSVNLVQLHTRTYIQKRTLLDKLPSVLLLVTMVGVVALWLVTGSVSSPQYAWLYSTLLAPSEASLYGLVGFFMAYAAYRGFRVRSIESGAMLIAAVLVILSQTTVGGAVWAGIPIIGSWVTNIPGTGAGRAFTITTQIGIFVLGARIILGKEKILGRG